MAINPYSPPAADIGTVESNAPKLWNPNAAANWCLLFSPIFGSLLHFENWKALGETEKADKAQKWVYFSCAMMVMYILAPFMSARLGILAALFQFAPLLTLIAWYYSAARPQTRYIKERFGDTYPRRGWGKPLLYAFGALIVVYVVIVFSAVILARM